MAASCESRRSIILLVHPPEDVIFVFGDDERYDVISALMITRVTVDRDSTPSNQTQ